MPSVTGAVSLTTGTGLPHYGVLTVIALIALLSAREVLSASRKWSRDLKNSLYMEIIPLLIVFIVIVMFKVAEIVHA